MTGMERRAAKRYRCGGRVEIPRSYSAVPLYGVVVDVSPAGCGIAVPGGVEFSADDADECVVELKFRSSYFAFRAKGAVCSFSQHREFGGAVLGVQFTEVTARGRADIAAFIEDQRAVELARVA